MSLSALDLFSVGIRPSSSHTIGPMRAARRFAAGLAESGLLDRTVRVQAQLYGSLGATGHGHGSDRAVVLGLEGEDPETVDTSHAAARVEAVRADRKIALDGTHRVDFDPDVDLLLHRRRTLPGHPNGMTFEAFDEVGRSLRFRTYYSWVEASSSTSRRSARTGSSRTTPRWHTPSAAGPSCFSAVARPGCRSPGS